MAVERDIHRQPASSKFVEELCEVREKIMEGRGGEILEDSTEQIRQQREERTKHIESVVRGEDV